MIHPQLLNFLKLKADSHFKLPDYEPIVLTKHINATLVQCKIRGIITNNNDKSFHFDRLARVQPYPEKRKLADNFPTNTSNIDILNKFENIFVFTDSYGDRNIWHWFVEMMPGILYLIDIIKVIPDIKIIINKTPKDTMISTIREFLYLIPGVTKDNIIEFEFKEDTGIYADNLYIGFSQCHHHTIKNIWNLIYFKLGLSDKCNKLSENKKYSKKVYLSRRATELAHKHNRKIVNIEKVSSIIREKGFIEVYPEKTDIIDKINIFNNADCVITELGSGFINLIHCKDGIDVILIYQDHQEDWIREWGPFIRSKKFNILKLSGKNVDNNCEKCQKNIRHHCLNFYKLDEEKLINFLDKQQVLKSEVVKNQLNGLDLNIGNTILTF